MFLHVFFVFCRMKIRPLTFVVPVPACHFGTPVIPADLHCMAQKTMAWLCRDRSRGISAMEA